LIILTAEDSPLQIYSLEIIDSTQRYLIDSLRSKRLCAPVAVTAARQTAGQGSRGNTWSGLEGNLFVSFAVKRSQMPRDLRLESSSLYFSYLLKETLSESGSAVWLKWPNDFYLQDKKIGGAITNLVENNLVCGIGLNLKAAPEGFGILDVSIEREHLLNSYFNKLEEIISWKQIFSKYALEFERNRDAFTHHNEKKIALKDAKLLGDGSIECNGQRIFSLR
jgi:BirA family biotin operon repressor/biotin-[acetyl-CoA-carboxylase] ligase